MQPQFDRLSRLLAANHYLNKNGCWVTDYKRIPRFRLKASTTNGTSGTAVYEGQNVYFWQNSKNVFIVERA